MSQLRIALLLILPTIYSFLVPDGKGDVFPGYVMLESGQRLEGLVVLGTFIESELKVKFIDRGKKKAFTPEEISAYGYEKTVVDDLGKKRRRWVHYERMEALEPPRIFAPTRVFVEREVAGDLDLFCFYIQLRGNVERPYHYYYLLRRADDTLVKLTETDYREVLGEELRAYPALVQRLGKRQFEFADVVRMLRDYNYWRQNQHAPEEYRVSPENFDG
ncbi:MAG: hypothetical protein AAFW73_23085 [Bacteroidota bacterium]